MHTAPGNQLFDRIILFGGILVLAAALTALELAHPTWNQVTDFTKTAYQYFPQAKSAEPAKTETKSTTVTTTPAKPAIKTAATTTYVHLRTAKNTTSAIITDLPPGTSVQLTHESDATWQGVTYQGKTGYIYRSYLQY